MLVEEPRVEVGSSPAQELRVGHDGQPEPAAAVGQRERAEPDRPPHVVLDVGEPAGHGPGPERFAGDERRQRLAPRRVRARPTAQHRRVRAERDDRPRAGVHRVHRGHELVASHGNMDLVARRDGPAQPPDSHRPHERVVPRLRREEPRPDRDLDRCATDLGEAEPPVGLDPDEQPALVEDRRAARGLNQARPEPGAVTRPALGVDDRELRLAADRGRRRRAGGEPLREPRRESLHGDVQPLSHQNDG